MLLQDTKKFKFKPQNVVKGCQKIEFDFMNTSFSEIFIFMRRNALRILMLINSNENKNFRFVKIVLSKSYFLQ